MLNLKYLTRRARNGDRHWQNRKLWLKQRKQKETNLIKSKLEWREGGMFGVCWTSGQWFNNGQWGLHQWHEWSSCHHAEELHSRFSAQANQTPVLETAILSWLHELLKAAEEVIFTGVLSGCMQPWNRNMLDCIYACLIETCPKKMGYKVQRRKTIHSLLLG